ncbi:hypothetical protein OJ253_2923 [Cryptosporidium canis]|uniref:Uncharacterized protein n=1 Tax=Cryptosporidium canis TaxID=195482 RepID=A0A9D5DHC0_9CRYT|nr:hypothetical protein OJ253_2923 [Cryptosporidium canis]
MSGRQIKLSSSVSALRFIQAAQTKVKHEELKKKQEKSLGWYLPGFEDVKTRGSELANKSPQLENIYILARKSFNSYNKAVERHNQGIVSRRKQRVKMIEEQREEEIMQNMYKKHRN